VVTVGLAIKTKDRTPRPNFLAETLQNLQRAGVFVSKHLVRPIHVVDSGFSPDPAYTYRAIQPTEQMAFVVDAADRTMHQNAARCIRLASGLGADWTMVIEDDIDVCDKFLECAVAWLEDHRDPGPQMYVFGANYVQIREATRRRQSFWSYPVDAFYGAQCCAWRTEDAIALADWLGEDPNYNGDRTHGHDLLLHQWGKVVGLKFFKASAPSFVQHIGAASVLNNEFFTFDSWPGRSWRYAGKRGVRK
jgi:hypothetical protein